MIALMLFRRNISARPRKERGPVKRLAGAIIKLAAACVLLAAATVLAINAYTVISTRDDVHTIEQLEQAQTQADAIVVLGASVLPDATPSDILADRLEVAVDLYKAGVAPVIIVSGDNRDSHYNESDAMKDYCVDLGVPADAVYVDHAGYDTYASMYRAHNAYGAQRIVVVTQAYHLYRALATAQGLGVEAQGVAADKGAYDNQLSYSMREAAARTKDFFQTLLKVEPLDATQRMTL